MKTKGVYTIYRHGGKEFSSYIAAMSFKQAKEIAEERNIGEKISSELVEIETLTRYYELSDEEFLKRLPDIFHQTLFLSFIRTSAGLSTSSDVLGDTALLHQLSHLQCKAYSPHATYSELLREVKDKLKMLYAATPGVLPGKYITVYLQPGENKKIERIIAGSDAINFGPAAITICDCKDPDCGITDDDQPCGYEQTIDERHMAALNTVSEFVYVHNRDKSKPAKVQLMVGVMHK